MLQQPFRFTFDINDHKERLLTNESSTGRLQYLGHRIVLHCVTGEAFLKSLHNTSFTQLHEHAICPHHRPKAHNMCHYNDYEWECGCVNRGHMIAACPDYQVELQQRKESGMEHMFSQLPHHLQTKENTYTFKNMPFPCPNRHVDEKRSYAWMVRRENG